MPARRLDRSFWLKNQITRFLLAFLATTPAAAQSLPNTPQREGAVLVVVVPPIWSEADAEATREAIGRELGVAAVAPSDPRAEHGSGTLRIDLDPSKGNLAVSYQERPRAITRTIPMPLTRQDMLKSIVVLSGNLARNEANELAHAMQPVAPPPTRLETPFEPSPPPKPPPPKRYWLGVALEIDGLSLPTVPNYNVCLVPHGYYCTVDGHDYDEVTSHGGGAVEGGFGIQNGRVLVSGDYEFTDNWAIGVRLGMAALSYPGTVAPHQGFGRFHLEARFTYLLGDRKTPDPRIYLLFAAGAAQYDAKEGMGGNSVPQVQAWKVYGPMFGSFGVGLRTMLTPDVALAFAPAKISLVFPYDTTIAWTPEASLQVGFSP
jgi:hypothetical protein